MKKFQILLTVLLIAVFFVFAAGSSDDEKNEDQGKSSVSDSSSTTTATEPADENLGDYKVIIDSCRLAEDYSDNPVVIVKYIFTNVKDENSASFSVALQDYVYQNGVGLNRAYILDEGAAYNSDNQSKQIKKGSSIEVEVAYELNDTTTDIEVEVQEWISFNDKKITKTFSISE